MKEEALNPKQEILIAAHWALRPYISKIMAATEGPTEMDGSALAQVRMAIGLIRVFEELPEEIQEPASFMFGCLTKTANFLEWAVKANTKGRLTRPLIVNEALNDLACQMVEKMIGRKQLRRNTIFLVEEATNALVSLEEITRKGNELILSEGAVKAGEMWIEFGKEHSGKQYH